MRPDERDTVIRLARENAVEVLELVTAVLGGKLPPPVSGPSKKRPPAPGSFEARAAHVLAAAAEFHRKWG